MQKTISKFFIITTFLLGSTLFFSDMARAKDDPANFYSYHQYPYKYSYYKDGEETFSSFEATGFKDQFNINDARIICQKEGNSFDKCKVGEEGSAFGKDKTYFGINLSQSTGTSLNSYTPIKIYMPPGTFGNNIIIYTSQTNIAASIEFNSPPDSCVFPVDYNDIAFEQPKQLPSYAGKCGFQINQDGHIQVLANGEFPKNILKKGGWLYIKLKDYQGSTVAGFQFYLTVNTSIYTTWYNCMTNNNLWDSNGDPNDTKGICDNGGGESTSTTDFTSTISNLTATFKDTSTGSPTAWSWDFGDNSTSTEQNPTHTYAKAGTYTVKLTANSISATRSITLTNSTTTTCTGKDSTCDRRMSTSTFCATKKPANSTAYDQGTYQKTCCDNETCYQCDKNYFWNAKTEQCEKTPDCGYAAWMYLSQKSGDVPLTITTNIGTSSPLGPFTYTNHSCGEGGTMTTTPTSGSGEFTCKYTNSGTYYPSVHVEFNSNKCAQDISAKVVVNQASTTDCASQTCLGNSCWNGTEYIAGTKTENCATGTATVTPDPLILPSTTETITWTTKNASKLDAQCYGLKAIAKGGWFTSNQACQTAGYCDSDGYKFQFDSTTQTGQEVCVLFPYNTTDGKSGTPFFAIMNINSSSLTKTDGKCGTANKTYDATATSYGSDTFCTQGTASPASPTFPTASTPTTWTCQGTNGGADASCKATLATSSTATDGKCGTANGKNYNPAAPSWGSDTFCTQGTCPVEPSFTGEELMTWTCQGTNGGANTECYATLSGNLSYSGICGTSARTYSASAVGWGEDVHFCAQGVRSPISVPVFPTVSDPITKWTCKGNNGGTDTSCKAILSTSQAATQTPGYTCQPDDPYCAARTCKDLVCFDGCKRQQGTKNCSGQQEVFWKKY